MKRVGRRDGPTIELTRGTSELTSAFIGSATDLIGFMGSFSRLMGRLE